MIQIMERKDTNHSEGGSSVFRAFTTFWNISVFRALLTKEMTSFFHSWTGYLIIALFLLLSGLVFWVFPTTSIPGQGYASMVYFFDLMPWLLLFFIPALNMRSFSEERVGGTLEWLLTKPISPQNILLSKFLYSLLVLIISFVPTFIYVFTLYELADPRGSIDLGSIGASYLGLLFIGAAFTAFSLLASLLTRHLVASFLLAVFFCFFFYSGVDLLAGLFSLDSLLGNNLAQFSMQTRFEALSRGVLDSGDLLFFLGFTAFVLYFCYQLLLDFLGVNTRWWSPALIVGLVTLVVTVLSGWWSWRVDFTADQRYSLAPVSRNVLQEIHARYPGESVEVTVLLDGPMSVEFQLIRKEVEALLYDLKSEMKSIQGGESRAQNSRSDFHFHFVNPLSGDRRIADQWAPILESLRLSPYQVHSTEPDGSLRQRLLYPYALLRLGEQERVIPLLGGAIGQGRMESVISMLEYRIVSALRSLLTQSRPLIAFTEGHGELDDLELHEAMYSIARDKDVGRIDLQSVELSTLEALDVMAIVRPRYPFSELEKFKIDYFLMKGGRLILALDQLNGSLDSLRAAVDGISGGGDDGGGNSGDDGDGGDGVGDGVDDGGGEGRTASLGERSQILLARELGLDDLLFNYGLRFQPDVLLDLNSLAVPMKTGGSARSGGAGEVELVPWPLHPLLIPMSDHPIVGRLPGIMTEYIGTIDTIATASPDLRKTVLLHSSPFVRSLPVGTVIAPSLVQNLPAAESMRTEPRPVAVLLEGRFPSAYRHRMHPVELGDDLDWAFENQRSPEFSDSTAAIFAISDGDVFRNQINPSDQSPYPLGWDRYTEQQFGNLSLLHNLLDYFLDSSDLIQLRNKEVFIYKIDRLSWQEARLAWQLLNVGLPLLLVIVCGWWRLWRRRKRQQRQRRRLQRLRLQRRRQPQRLNQ